MYAVSENGQIYSTFDYSDDNIPLDLSLYNLPLSGGDNTVSMGDVSVAPSDNSDVSLLPISPSVVDGNTSNSQPIDIQELSDALYSAISTYPIYPSSASVSVFEMVAEGLPSDYGYYMVSGFDSYTTYFYYSDNWSVEDNVIVLSGNVTKCSYYRTRQSSSSSWEYHYSVDNDVGLSSVSLFDDLVYTNLVEGYPTFTPYISYNILDKISSFIIPSIAFVIFLLAFISVKSLGRSLHD